MAVAEPRLRPRRCQALQTIYGVGPILACHILAELGEATRFRRARQACPRRWPRPRRRRVGETRRRGRLAKHGSPELRWALVRAGHQAQRQTSPDHALYAQVRRRSAGQRAALTVARKIARRSYHVLRELETQAA